MPDSKEPKEPGEARPAAEELISLSQAVLAPLDAILKAQLHAGRSFLNMLLQLGYPHQPDSPAQQPPRDGKPYTLDFVQETVVNGAPRRQRISLPALALVPVSPLAVESARFSFDMAVRDVAPHRQLKVSEAGEASAPRPWFLVHEPVSVRGTLAPSAPAEQREGGPEADASIHIELKVASTKVPAGLDRLLTTLTQIATVEDADAK
ncbi:MAG TPA: DUF2589 domain-containing protein [Myxococcales bacterium]|nr:DUF2589 domain-containing protein [Myxococcales bacterium]